MTTNIINKHTYNGKHFIIHINQNDSRSENSGIKDYLYDLIPSSRYAYLPMNKQELKEIADFIYKVIDNDKNSNY